MKHILLTGASGFLGSALAKYLAECEGKVSLLLRQKSRIDHLKGLESSFEICRFQKDLDIKEFVARIKPDVVVHTACAYGRNGETELEMLDANVRFGLNILQSLVDNKKSATFINTGTVLAPEVSTYALMKDQFAQIARAVATKSQDIKFINVRLQHMYGPGDDRSKFATHVLHACKKNEPELKLTAGEQKRDFIYIDDVVSAYATLLKCEEKLEPIDDIEIGSGTAPSVRNFVEKIHKLTGSNTKLLFGALPYRSNEAKHCQADISRLANLGWKPMYDLEAGLKKMIELEFLL